MELIIFKQHQSKRKGYFIGINRQEALSIISSLAQQLESYSCNSGRSEFFTVKGESFTIAVHEPYDTKPPNKG